MKNFYILAAGDDQLTEGYIVSGESITDESSETMANESMTVADGSNGSGEGTTAPPPKPGFMQFWPLILIFVVMYFIMFRGPKKKQQQHNKMVQSMKKNDKVRTIGGILGTVIDIKDDEITLKIDESNNTKIKITPGAVSKVLSNEVG